MKRAAFTLCSTLTVYFLCLASPALAQISSFQYSWSASGPALCGSTGGSWTLAGFQMATLTWGFYFEPPYSTSEVYYTWTLGDELGVIVSYTWDSSSNDPNGLRDSGQQFTIPRYPVGEPYFVINGYIVDSVNGCRDSVNFYAGYIYNFPFFIQVDTTKKYEFKNKHSGLVAEIPGSSEQDGTVLDQNSYAGDGNQLWIFPSNWDGTGAYKTNALVIEAEFDSKAMWISSAASGQLVYQKTPPQPGGSPTPTTWRPLYEGNGYYRIDVFNSMLALSVVGESTAKGAQLQIRNWASTDDQEWAISTQ
jgi:Ricin-type beta-trefoil lectin domain-like